MGRIFSAPWLLTTLLYCPIANPAGTPATGLSRPRSCSGRPFSVSQLTLERQVLHSLGRNSAERLARRRQTCKSRFASGDFSGARSLDGGQGERPAVYMERFVVT